MNRNAKALEEAQRLIEKDGFKIEDSLAGFSAAEAAEIRPLLQAILAVQEQAGALPEPVEKSARKAGFLAELAQLKALPAEPVGFAERLIIQYKERLHSKMARTFAAVMAALVLTGGVAAAAGSSGPGSPLYPIKRAVEAVDTALPRSEYAQAKLHLNLAETRLGELEAAGDKRDETYRRLSGEFISELDKAKAPADGLSTSERREIFQRYEELMRRYESIVRQTESGLEARQIRPARDNEVKPAAPAEGSQDQDIDKDVSGSENQEGGTGSWPQADENEEIKIPESEDNSPDQGAVQDGQASEQSGPDSQLVEPEPPGEGDSSALPDTKN